MGKGRKPCCDKSGVKKGPWSEAEDLKLMSFIQRHGHSNWRALPRLAGLARCGKSCRLRWVNYLRPDLKRGSFSPQEEETIIKLHERLGNRWSKIASHFPGRTDNEIKNVWNTHLRKRAKDKELSDINPEHSSISSSTSFSSQASFSDNPKSDQVGCPRDEMVIVDNNLLDDLTEIPFEPNYLDLWDSLENGDSMSNTAESEAQFSKFDQVPDCPVTEDDNRNTYNYKEDNSSCWWLIYLENELELDHAQPTHN